MSQASASFIRSRREAIGALILFSSFALLLIAALMALVRIDAVYQETQAALQRSMRSIVLERETGRAVVDELRIALAELDKLERIAVNVEIDASEAGLPMLISRYQEGALPREAFVEAIVAAFDGLELRLVNKRASINASFYALVGAMGFCLVAAVLSAAFLGFRLSMSRYQAAWTQESLKRVLAAEERLRRRIANDLHDGAAQDIAAARMLCERISAGLSADPDEGAETLESYSLAARAAEATSILASAGRTIRGVALDLRPPELERGGLVHALESLCARSFDARGRNVTFSQSAAGETSSSYGAIADDAAIQAYRIVQEAMANAKKHASDHRIEVTVREACDRGMKALTIAVRDFGDGEVEAGRVEGQDTGRLDESSSSGLGMAIMRERAGLIGARLAVVRAADGWSVELCIQQGDS